MADDEAARGSLDSKHIRLSEDYEVRYWAQVLDISEQQPRDAVKGLETRLLRCVRI